MSREGAIVLVLVCAFATAVSQILLKEGAKRHGGGGGLSVYLNAFVLAGYAVFMFVTFGMIHAFRFLDYKYGPILASASYVFVVILGVFVLRERLSLRRLAGASFIIIGILLFNI